MFSLRIWILLLLLCVSRFGTAATDLWILDVRGPIGVATMEYVVSSIDLANSDKTPRQPTVIFPNPMDFMQGLKQILENKVVK
jgi:membrane-bound ClpP family serine protease